MLHDHGDRVGVLVNRLMKRVVADLRNGAVDERLVILKRLPRRFEPLQQ